jgi:hypothetical protein
MEGSIGKGCGSGALEASEGKEAVERGVAGAHWKHRNGRKHWKGVWLGHVGSIRREGSSGKGCGWVWWAQLTECQILFKFMTSPHYPTANHTQIDKNKWRTLYSLETLAYIEHYLRKVGALHTPTHRGDGDSCLIATNAP